MFKFEPVVVCAYGELCIPTDVIPSHWDLSRGLSVRLAPTDPEYTQVAHRFARTSQCKILSIDRIQNEKLYAEYQTKKVVMDGNPLSTNKSNEQRLFHGTDFTTALKIQTQGFDRNFAGKHGEI